MMSSEGGNGNEQDFELNLASIIDCFTVLITYLLVSASFITLGVLDVTVAASTTTGETAPPDLTITIKLNSNGDLNIDTLGKEKNNLYLAAQNGTMDLKSMESRLQELKAKFPSVNSAMVTAADAVKYRDLVKAVEKTKSVLPQVALSAEAEAL